MRIDICDEKISKEKEMSSSNRVLVDYQARFGPRRSGCAANTTATKASHSLPRREIPRAKRVIGEA